MPDKFLVAIVFWANLMGVEPPPVFDRENLPGLQAARVVFDGYGWRVERDKGSLVYKLWNKSNLALHEMCHIRYHDFTHDYTKQCMTEYTLRAKREM